MKSHISHFSKRWELCRCDFYVDLKANLACRHPLPYFQFVSRPLDGGPEVGYILPSSRQESSYLFIYLLFFLTLGLGLLIDFKVPTNTHFIIGGYFRLCRYFSLEHDLVALLVRADLYQKKCDPGKMVALDCCEFLTL